MYRVIIEIGYCKAAFDFADAEKGAKFMTTAVEANVEGCFDNLDKEVCITMEYVKDGEDK